MGWREKADKCSEWEQKQHKYNLSRTEKIGSKLDPRAKLNRPHNGVRITQAQFQNFRYVVLVRCH